ncbi:hypothetical protein BCR39DRAFT_531983 [Naematelia encephala]|uniref:Calpain catalytic domain-containing protein n=1 Tax=Naematelia encephala TaxID=71784 RepID=A0A1Y2B3W8_9TREE|nr:hypothetical protein BCR39DRAFT_531983 [Naematelia encephala]
MSYKTYQQGLKNATELANKAIQSEASLSTLSPLMSPLPTLHQTFPLYVSAAEAYSNLLSSSTVPESERLAIKKKWRLVLERAEKIKLRIAQLGDQVGRAAVGDAGEEDNIVRRGGIINGVVTEIWNEAGPSCSEFTLGKQGVWTDASQPPLAKEQIALSPEWAEIDKDSWNVTEENSSRWMVKQGPGADCSVVAGLGVCMEHNRLWGTRLGQSALYPQAVTGQPKHSENGKHVVKLLLNGAWRQVVIDSLLPRATDTEQPLHATATTSPPSTSTSCPAWLPLSIKAYFKTLGGYDIRGSNPAPDIYAFTGWIPERSSFKEGMQREKEWLRVYSGWQRGNVLVTLGTGETTSDRLIPLHAYGVLDMQVKDGERILEVFDPGASKQSLGQSGLAERMDQLSLKSLVTDDSSPSYTSSGGNQTFHMTWDEVCTEFEALNVNWNPTTMPVLVKRYWSWPKPSTGVIDEGLSVSMSNPRYKLSVMTSSSDHMPEIWILLSQHIVSKDRPMDDIGLHIFEEPESALMLGKNQLGKMGALHPERTGVMSPYTNGLHLLVRYQLRHPRSSLLVVPSRDRGLYRTDFTLQAFAPSGTTMDLQRVSRTLAFSQTVTGELTSRNSGGHSGLSSWMSNPQYRFEVLPRAAAKVTQQAGQVKVMLCGDKSLAWNVKILWGRGELVYSASEDSVVGDSGAYGYGITYLDLPNIKLGTYTMVVSTFEPRETGSYTLTVESTGPIKLEQLPPEGAGMYSRIVTGSWSELNAAGRPSLGQYEKNPKIEIILSRPSTIMIRIVPSIIVPINMTLFRRSTSSSLGEQITTSGPYSETITGILIPRLKLDSGIYLGVISSWDLGMGIGVGWKISVWSDSPLNVDYIS